MVSGRGGGEPCNKLALYQAGAVIIPFILQKPELHVGTDRFEPSSSFNTVNLKNWLSSYLRNESLNIDELYQNAPPPPN